MPSTRAGAPTESSIGALPAPRAERVFRRKKPWTQHGGGPSRWGVYAACARTGVPREQWAQRFAMLRKEWKRSVVRRREAQHGLVPRNAREAAFARAFVEEYVKRAMASDGQKLRNVRREAALAALPLAGYRKRHDAKKGYELLGLPRVQAEVRRAFAEQGVTLELSGQVLAEIMRHGLDDGVAAGAQLKAVELFLRATTGFAVQKQAHLHERVKRDKFFDEATFTAPAAPVLTIDAENPS